jgi:hypothetical protein
MKKKRQQLQLASLGKNINSKVIAGLKNNCYIILKQLSAMACKKSELVSAINSFSAAYTTSDANLIKFSGKLVTELLETLEFEPEEKTNPEGVSSDDQPE